ncbi:hypothetical protein ACQP1P_16755 [Dactylosporangium sp. CA-052675]|uniref:hypothetical protein n=1 Tax=Dactylosporangium sp. CA-052675 TaxID=3239927 RepID=UPI003D8A0937
MRPEPPDFPADRLLARKEQVMTAFLEMPPDHAAPAPRRRARTLALAGVAATATAIAAAAALIVAGPAAEPAYALSPNADGSVTFTINDTRDPAGATAALRAAGIHAVVRPGHRPGECPPEQRGTRDGRPWSTLTTAVQSLEYRRRHPDALHSVVIQPDRIPPGAVLVIGTVEGALNGERVVVVLPELFTDPGPACYETDFDLDRYIRIEPAGPTADRSPFSR